MLKGVIITHLTMTGYGFVIQKVIHTYNMDAGNNAIALQAEGDYVKNYNSNRYKSEGTLEHHIQSGCHHTRRLATRRSACHLRYDRSAWRIQ